MHATGPGPLIGRVAGTLLVAALLAGAGYGTWRYTLVAVPTDSMAPTIDPGDRLVIDRRGGVVRVGDVVVVDAPAWEAGQRTTLVVKRVVAVGGQKVACCDPAGRVSVDGVPLTGSAGAPSVRAPDGRRLGGPFSVTVPAGRLFLMGDNRSSSVDSRAHLDAESGSLPVSAVVGHVAGRAWPPARWGALR